MAEHLSADDLTELALRPSSPPDARQRAHLRVCGECAGELRQLRRVVESARSATIEDLLVPPPAGVWDAVSAELDLAVTAARDGHAGHGPPGPDGPSGPPAPGRSPRRGRWRRSGPLLAAAGLVAGLLTGSAATWWRTHEDRPPAAAVLTAPLAPVAAPAAEGTVRIHRGADTRRAVTVSVSGLPPTPGYYEVWLMDRTHTKLIAVGVLGSDGTATLPLPDGVDLAGYPLLDVSAQVYDGDPAHSGKSVVRGDLPPSAT
ncbi:anti-sigma factor [Streptomyces sp. NPDC014773]|uniref:anti-sigma factor n=1 Tax=Streptomyces sp. NPDC014773 TaxID=3364908 RepID=UPI0036FF2E41